MHVRAATVHIQPGNMQELIDLYKDEMAPAVKAKKGFQGQYLMTDVSLSRGNVRVKCSAKMSGEVVILPLGIPLMLVLQEAL